MLCLLLVAKNTSLYLMLTENDNVKCILCIICFKGLLVLQQPITSENSITIYCISMVSSN